MKKLVTNLGFLKNWEQKKHLHNVQRKLIKKKKKKRKEAEVYISDIVNMLSYSIPSSQNSYGKKTLLLQIPENFSIIDNPIESLKVILGFAKDIRNYDIKEILYDHSKVEKIDLSAESILGCLAGEIYKEQKRRNIKENGYYPNKYEAVRLIKSVGVIKNLNVTHEFLGYEESKSLPQHLQRRSGKEDGGSGSHAQGHPCL